MISNFTKKQADFLSDILKNKHRINILHGSVRSGKTIISLVAWILLIAESPKYSSYLMVGKTLTTLKRNCLSIIQSILPLNAFEFSLTKKEAIIYGRKIYLEGVNDTRAENKIRGLTLNAAYCDELTLFPEDFFSMLLSRLSQKGSFLLGTTNPDSPSHWLLKKFINAKRNIDIKTWKFLLDDNTSIPSEIRNQMKNEYTGVFYDRFILGKWVKAEGLVYPIFSNRTNRYIVSTVSFVSCFDCINIGLDYGASSSKTALIAVAFCDRFTKVIVLDEMVISGVNEPDKLYKQFCDFYWSIVVRYGPVNSVYADWGGLGQVITKGLKEYCAKERIQTIVRDCIKLKIIERISAVQQLMSTEKIFIMDTCKTLIEALSNSVWDPNHDDIRLDDGTIDMDVIDAMEYALIPQINIVIKTKNYKKNNMEII